MVTVTILKKTIFKWYYPSNSSLNGKTLAEFCNEVCVIDTEIVPQTGEVFCMANEELGTVTKIVRNIVKNPCCKLGRYSDLSFDVYLDADVRYIHDFAYFKKYGDSFPTTKEEWLERWKETKK